MRDGALPRPIHPLPPAPPRVPVSAQSWVSLSMLHWPVPAEQVQALLPNGLIADEYEGQSWLGVVPFVMSGVRQPPLPALGKGSTFPELNVRVYVHDLEGNRGVWFLGLWCSSPGFVALARTLGLSYHRVLSSVESLSLTDRAHALSYRFLRADSRSSDISFSAIVRPSGPADASSGLEAWMTARWNMFALRAGRLWRYQVHHEPWRLQTAVVEDLRTNAHERFGFAAPRASPLVHMAEPVHTLVSSPRLCRRR